ncbi:MAG: hypothetical protein DHS20C11_26490 [Lysobacteraceae bacterium]|nr:MAG: hypothetical protein DHS20C11_26490 [Xanthomonadaceae bacterium]
MQVPGYSIKKEIGRGGMATVYLAVQESLDREVALKVMSVSLVSDETFCKRFVKEGRIAARLTHPNLLTVYDIGQYEDTYYMASEYLSAGSVRQRMAQGLTPTQTLKIIKDIASGLQFAHENGFVHRDVKPGNLLFRRDGTCVLADFGIAKGLHSNTIATKIGTSIGTPHYMSPEQARGDKVDGRTDIYSLGICWFEMLTGRVPFDGDNPFSVAMAQINDPVPELPADLARFQPVINRMLEKNRQLRFADAGELLALLEQSAKKRPAPKPEPVTDRGDNQSTRVLPSAPRNKAGSRWTQISMALLGVVLVAVVGYFAYTQLGNGELEQGMPVVDSEQAQTLPPQNDAAGGGSDTALADQTPTEASQSPADTTTDSQPVDVAESAAVAGDSEVRALLQQGDAYFQNAQYAYPPGQNATDMYREVLAIDPNNAHAQQRMRDLAAIWADAAESSLRDGKASLAGRLIKRGLEADPDNARLQELQKNL